MQGRSSAHTGENNSPWAGSRRGAHYTVQGNLLEGPGVVDAVAGHFESTAGIGMPLAERLLLALEAGQRAGGDRRKGNLQSAAIRVADPDEPGRAGDHLSVVIDVGEHPTPVLEMKRIYYTTERRLGYRSFSEIRGTDVIELKRRLRRLGYLETEAGAIPDTPEFDTPRELSRDDPAEFQAAVRDFEERMESFLDRWGVYDESAMDAVDAFRRDHGLDHPGNPRGLVDSAVVGALVEALRRSEQAAAAAP